MNDKNHILIFVCYVLKYKNGVQRGAKRSMQIIQGFIKVFLIVTVIIVLHLQLYGTKMQPTGIDDLNLKRK